MALSHSAQDAPLSQYLELAVVVVVVRIGEDQPRAVGDAYVLR